jgi:hypothetical protein
MLNPKRGLEMEFVGGRETESDYRRFAKAFESAAVKIERIDLAWKQLHLFQLLYRDLMASTTSKGDTWREKVFLPLFNALKSLVGGPFRGEILDRMSASILVSWGRIAKKLHGLGRTELVEELRRHVTDALDRPILQVADSLWRFQGHRFTGVGDLDCDSFGADAFNFRATLATWSTENLGINGDPSAGIEELQKPAYFPYLLARDWRGLSYRLKACEEKELKELAAAFALRAVGAIASSGIAGEHAWYRDIKHLFLRQ